MRLPKHVAKVRTNTLHSLAASLGGGLFVFSLLHDRPSDLAVDSLKGQSYLRKGDVILDVSNEH